LQPNDVLIFYDSYKIHVCEEITGFLILINELYRVSCYHMQSNSFITTWKCRYKRALVQHSGIMVNSEQSIGTTEYPTLCKRYRIHRCRYSRVRL
jgi:hypothetical protein